MCAGSGICLTAAWFSPKQGLWIGYTLNPSATILTLIFGPCGVYQLHQQLDTQTVSIMKCLSLALAIAIAAPVILSSTALADEAITHSFLACGSQTYIVDGDGHKTWTYPHATRDGYVLPNGHVLLTVSKCKPFPGGAVVEIDRQANQPKVIWKGTQSEVNSAQPTASGGFVLTEAGEQPRLIELSADGEIACEFPLKCQKANHHMQTRMARKLRDGTFLAPHLLDFAVFRYDADGKLLGKFETSVAGDTEHKIHTWPFTAIRHGDGRTLVCCTHGNRVVDFDANGDIVWQLTNDDLPGPWLQDPCGAQVLPSGNVVIASYAAGHKDPKAPKLLEVNQNKEVVWSYRDGQKAGIHHFQILDVNGVPLPGEPLK